MVEVFGGAFSLLLGRSVMDVCLVLWSHVPVMRESSIFNINHDKVAIMKVANVALVQRNITERCVLGCFLREVLGIVNGY